MADTQFEILEQLLYFPTRKNSPYRKELNIIRWYGKEPKYDLRGWNADHTKMTKGFSLSEEEFNILKEYLGGK